MKDSLLNILQGKEKSDIAKKNTILFFAIFFFIVILIILIAIAEINGAKIDEVYNKAVALVENGSYNEAKELFKEIEETKYHDTCAYIDLCKGLIYYKNGNAKGAYYYIKNTHFVYLSSEQKELLDDFLKKLRIESDAFELKEYRNRIARGVPYVGMSESEIGNTSLGAPSSDVRHDTEMINGKSCVVNVYDFKSGNNTIFSAQCVHGSVSRVWDFRDNPVTPSTKKKNTKPKPKKEDRYDVNNYSNEEDFYYDHYDDFFDYYDAEDYYNEYHE